MMLRLTLVFVTLATLLIVPRLRAQQPSGILLGVLEDHAGNYAGQPYFRAVRIVFENKGNEWRAFPSACPDQECLKTISSHYPQKVNWTIGLQGKILGSVTGRTYHEFPFYSEIGLQNIISSGPVPTVGKRSEEFADFTGAVDSSCVTQRNSQVYWQGSMAHGHRGLRQSDILFQVGGENLGGYELFYDRFRKHVSFTFNYH